MEFAETFGLNKTVIYQEVRELVRQLQRKIVKLKPSETLSGDCVEVAIISKQMYREHEGRVWIRFDEDIVPHLIGLREQFTTYKLKDVYQFQSSHTWRTYELLRQYKSIGRREFDIDDLRDKLGLSGFYLKVNNLIQRVIKPSVEEINAVSDISVQLSTVKTMRRVTGVLFRIIDNQANKTPREKIRAAAQQLDDGANKAPDLAKLLREEYRVSATQARQLANLAADHEDTVRTRLPKLKARYDKLKEKKTSLGGYVFMALKDELTVKQRKLPI